MARLIASKIVDLKLKLVVKKENERETLDFTEDWRSCQRF
jgi:hypothetical protein